VRWLLALGVLAAVTVVVVISPDAELPAPHASPLRVPSSHESSPGLAADEVRHRAGVQSTVPAGGAVREPPRAEGRELLPNAADLPEEEFLRAR
jgi:hypothetical protein